VDGKAVWAKCQARGCPDCGPEIRERNLAHDLANMVDRQMIRRVVARSAWPALRAKIKRAGGLRVTYPQPGGMLAVYATAGSMTGTVVMDAPAQLAADYEGIPRGESIRRSGEWALNPKVKRLGPPRWRSLGTSTVTDRIPLILHGLGLYRGEVDEGAVPLEAWEVHNFTVPERDTSAFDRFAFAVGLVRGSGVVEHTATASGMVG
jgi:hypothetical protein